MKILCLDLGDKRIGLAISDQSGKIAFPIGTHKRVALAKDVQTILKLIESNAVCKIVVGMPFTLKGTLGHQARKTNIFAKALRRAIHIPLETFDERLSSTEAKIKLHDLGLRIGDDKSKVDTIAASIILQRYLDNSENATQT